MIVALSVLRGGSFFFNAVALQELPTLTVVVGRVLLAALILGLAMRALRLALPTDRVAWFSFFAMGLINNVVPFTLIVWGQTHVASGVASILNATTPLFTVIVAHWLTTDEKLTRGRLTGVVMGLTGVEILIGRQGITNLGMHVLAQLAILTAALAYAFAGVFGRRFRRLGITPMATATGQVTASSIMLVPLMLAIDKPWTLPMPGAFTIGSLVGVAALSTALADVLYFRILATAAATNLLLVTFLIPASAVLLGVLVLGEALRPAHVAGMFLIGLGLAAVDGRAWKLLQRFVNGRDRTPPREVTERSS